MCEGIDDDLLFYPIFIGEVLGEVINKEVPDVACSMHGQEAAKLSIFEKSKCRFLFGIKRKIDSMRFDFGTKGGRLPDTRFKCHNAHTI